MLPVIRPEGGAAVAVTPAPGHALLPYVAEIAVSDHEWSAVHVRLSQLMPQNRRDRHRAAAAGAFDRLVAGGGGRLFRFPSGDLMLVFASGVREDVERAIRGLRFLFADDPFLASDLTGTHFAAWYAVTRDRDRFFKVVKVLAGEGSDLAPDDVVSLSFRRTTVLAPVTRLPLTPHGLSRLESALSRADISLLVRRQTACQVFDRGVLRPWFTEIYVSIAHLRDALAPETDLTANAWLCRQLTRTLDGRILAFLMTQRGWPRGSDPSLNLNVATILSPAFERFDEDLGAGRRGTVIIEVNPVDALSDVGAFLRARDLLHERAYRVALDCVGHRQADLISRSRLGIDLVKMTWDPDILDLAPAPLRRLKDAIASLNPDRVALCRVDRPEAVALGRSFGIGLFQGHLIEHMRREREAAEARRPPGSSGGLPGGLPGGLKEEDDADT